MISTRKPNSMVLIVSCTAFISILMTLPTSIMAFIEMAHVSMVVSRHQACRDKVAPTLGLWGQLGFLNFALVGQQADVSASQYSGDLENDGTSTHDCQESVLCNVWQAIEGIDGRRRDVYNLAPY